MQWISAEDPRGELYSELGGLGMPFTVFITADGEVVERHNGPLSEQQLRDKIAEELKCDYGYFAVSAKNDLGGINSMVVEMVDCALEAQEEELARQEKKDSEESRTGRPSPTVNIGTVNLNMSHKRTSNNCKC